MATTYMTLTNQLLSRLNETALTQSQFPNASGFNGQAKLAINAAINDIVHKFQYWPFLKVQKTITTNSTTNEYTISQALAPIDFYTVQINKNSAVTPAIVQSALTFMDYHLYKRYRYPVDAQADSTQYSQPQWVTRPPTGNTIILSPWPDRAYVVSYETWEMPADLINFDDVTVIPDQFVSVLINRATWYAYMFRENIEAADKIEKKSKEGMDDMLRMIVPGFTDAKDPRVTRPRSLTGPSRFF